MFLTDCAVGCADKLLVRSAEEVVVMGFNVEAANHEVAMFNILFITFVLTVLAGFSAVLSNKTAELVVKPLERIFAVQPHAYSIWAPFGLELGSIWSQFWVDLRSIWGLLGVHLARPFCSSWKIAPSAHETGFKKVVLYSVTSWSPPRWGPP